MYFFRRMLGSKIGGYFAIGFLLLIGVAFVLTDMSGTGNLTFRLPGSSSNTVAKVGGQVITTEALQSRAQTIFERMREENPELTIDQFLNEGMLRQVADDMISTQALIVYGEKHGMRISKALVDAQIASNGAFVDATGNFSETVFRQLLAQRRISEQEFRDDITAQIIQQQVLAPVGAGSRAPDGMVPPYAAMLIEERKGELFAVPSTAFAPKEAPSDAELQAYYTANPGQFSIPERRKLRYALVNLARFESAATPTQAELEKAYKDKASQYKARQVRDVSQLILASEAAAKDAAAKAKAGQALADVARGLGLAAMKLADQEQDKLASQTSTDIAKAAFAAQKGAVLGPYRTALGWSVLRVDDARETPGKTLEQARAELEPEVRAAKQKVLFSEFLNDIDGKLGDGSSFAELAKTNQLTLVETPLLTKDGRAPDDPAYQPDPAMAEILKQAFNMSVDDDPQIVAVKQDEEAAIVAVSDVVPAGPPPFAQVKAAVQVLWGLSKGAEKARQVATQLAAELGKGTEPAAALAKLNVPQIQRQPIEARRADLSRSGGQVPPPLEALFTLNKGATRMLPLENNQGFVVVRLDSITPQDPLKVPQLIASTQAGLANVLGGEYARQFMTAIQRELGVTRNDAAIASVEKALREANGGGGEQ
ncbi:MAG TPA: peptidyl-prolyl cis-trans isomerase [Sphingobium sp.]|nr:peptidyl-prolyl cis-trans isomerase [Sphingobium sp.]